MLGKIYNRENYIIVKFNGYTIESVAPIPLKEIKKVKEWDTDGYFVLDTNYGEEYLDLAYIIKELDLDIDLQNELSKIENFEVRCNNERATIL